MSQRQNAAAGPEKAEPPAGSAGKSNRFWSLLPGEQVPLAWFLLLGWGFFCLLLASGSGARSSLPQRENAPLLQEPSPASVLPPSTPSASSSQSATVKSRKRPSFQVDLNRATWVELAQLPGVGPVLAKRIVQHRRQHGAFRRVDHLLRVRGIGPRRLERLRPFLMIDRAD